jgi:putative Holliday junction resolvase
MKLLAIDFGLRKIGLAMADGDLAEPLMVISNRPQVINALAKICQDYGIQKIIIGMPEGEMARKVRSFSEELARKSKLSIIYRDETLTTKEAIAKMVEAGRRKKYRREKEDAFAAALILQEYLDR